MYYQITNLIGFRILKMQQTYKKDLNHLWMENIKKIQFITLFRLVTYSKSTVNIFALTLISDLSSNTISFSIHE